jgi:hypothetical protein
MLIEYLDSKNGVLKILVSMQLDFKKKNSDVKFCGQGIVWWWLKQLIKNPNFVFFLTENPNFVIITWILLIFSMFQGDKTWEEECGKLHETKRIKKPFQQNTEMSVNKK